MATRIWTGATDTQWDVTTNWTPNGAVQTGDTVVIPASATNDLLTDLDRTGDVYNGGGLFGLNLASLQVAPGSTVKVGTAAAPLKCTVDSLIFAGANDFYFSSQTGTAVQVTDKVIVDSDSLNNVISLAGTADITRVDFIRGSPTVSMTSSATVVYAHVAPRDGRFYDVNLTFATAGNQPTNLFIRDGTVNCPGAGNLILRGGSLVNNSPAKSSLFVYSYVYQTGGYFDFTTSGIVPTAPAGDPEIWLLAGTFDASRVPGYASSEIGTIRVFPGAIFKKNDLLVISGSEITIGE